MAKSGLGAAGGALRTLGAWGTWGVFIVTSTRIASFGSGRDFSPGPVICKAGQQQTHPCRHNTQPLGQSIRAASGPSITWGHTPWDWSGMMFFVQP